jgi:hypothetical protein
VAGAPEVPAGGSSFVEVLALFAILCAKVSASLRKQVKVNEETKKSQRFRK